MNTRRRTAAAAAAADGMTITSTQPLRGRKQPKSAAAEQTRSIKQKTARVEKKTAIVKQKTKDTKEEIGSEKDRIDKARRKLDALLRKKEQAVKEELVENGMNVSVNKDGVVTGVTMPVLKAAAPLYEALDLPMIGSTRTRVGKSNQKTLPPTHAAATKMQRLTGSTLTEEDVQGMESKARWHGTEMEFGGFKINGIQITNDHGKKVDKNRHIFGKETYKAGEEKGTGLAKQNAEICLNLIDTIPETVALYNSICAMLTDEEGRGVGFDFRQLPDDYQG
jgi:hypothetical protein